MLATHALPAATVSVVTRWGQLIGAQCAAALLALLLLVSVLYATSNLFVFAGPRAFSGPQWYNPYDVLVGEGKWQKANFHAHSIAWRGLTNGAQSPHEVASAYDDLRYDVIGVSNYHSLAAGEATGTFPVYEHGWNVQKAHRLVIGSQEVVWRDYPLGQTVHQQQDIIDRLRRSGAVVALAHPAIRNGHSPNDLRRLSGYDALEVLNHFVTPAYAHWDAALSAGRAVWVLASDDSHDIHGTGETGVNWTLFHAASSGTTEVLSAIRAGHTIGVQGFGGVARLGFLSQRMRGDTLEVRVRGHVGRLRVTGQGGQPREVQVMDSAGVTIGRAVARAEDGYLRATIEGHPSAERPGRPELMLLNPVIRWDGQRLGVPPAAIDRFRTAMLRLAACAMYATLLGVARGAMRTRRPARVPRARPLPT